MTSKIGLQLHLDTFSMSATATSPNSDIVSKRRECRCQNLVGLFSVNDHRVNLRKEKIQGETQGMTFKPNEYSRKYPSSPK